MTILNSDIQIFVGSKENSQVKSLLKVEMNNQFESIRDVLNHIEMNVLFIKTIPYDSKFDILNEILINEDRWLSMNAK